MSSNTTDNGVSILVKCPECDYEKNHLPWDSWHQYCPECGERTETEPQRR